jgi:uncharacterized protein (TIGR02270 family)
MAWEDILLEHADEAAFLFELRGIAYSSFRQTPASLLRLEERLAAHLDGLLVDPALAFQSLEPWLESERPGEAFVAGWLALEGGAPDWAESLGEKLAEPISLEGLSGALRLAGPRAEPWLERFAKRDPLGTRALALDALAFRGKAVDSPPVRALFESGNPLAKLAAVGIAARRRLREFRAALTACCGDADAHLARRALQALALLGDPEAVTHARAALRREDAAGATALRLLGAIGGPQDSGLIPRHVSGPHAREALLALGRLGDPSAAETLLSACENPEQARAAGHALEILTGARIEFDRMALPPAERDEKAPALKLDPDDGLPSPDAGKLQGWWSARAGKVKRGERLRRGEPFEWEAVALEALEPELPLPDHDHALLELSARLPLNHVERRDWSARSAATLPSARDVRRIARERGIEPWPTA